MGEQIYLAGRWRDRYRLRDVRARLNELGHTVTSRWIDGEGRPDDYQWTDRIYPDATAKRDKADIDAASLLILDLTEGSSTRGGMYWEGGYAEARLGMDRVWIIGPQTNVFTYEIEHPHFEDWKHLFRFLQSSWYRTRPLEVG